MWSLLVENKLGITNALYIHLLTRKEKGGVEEKVRSQIEKDLRRSFSGNTTY